MTRFFFSLITVFYSLTITCQESSFLYSLDTIISISNKILESDIDHQTKLQKLEKLKNEVLKSDSSQYVSIPMFQISNIHFEQGNFKKSLRLEKEILTISKKNKRIKDVFTARNNISSCYTRMGLSDSSLSYTYQNYTDLEKINDVRAKITVLNNLGLHYSQNNNYEKALGFFEEIEQIAIQEDNPIFLEFAISNKCNLYRKLELYDKAIESALKTLEINPKNYNAINELALVYKIKKDYEKAIKTFERGIGILSNDQHFYLANFKCNIAIIYNITNHYEKALPLLHEAKKHSEFSNAKNLLQIIYSQLAIALENTNKHKEALQFERKAYQLKDSLNNIEIKDRIAKLETNIEIQTKENELQKSFAENEIKQKELSVRNTQILVSFFMLFTLIIITIYVIIINKKLNKTKEALEISNATKDKFFSIIAHDLRSPLIALQGVGQKLNFYINKNKQEKLLEVGDKIDQAVEKVNLLLNNLLSWAVSQTSGISLKMEKLNLKQVAEEVISLNESLLETKNLSIDKSKLEDCMITADYNTVNLILRNLLSNAIKFSEEGGLISVILDEKNKSIEIIDQGRGMNAATLELVKSGKTLGENKGKDNFGLGMQLVKEFVAMNKAEMIINSQAEKGTSIKVQFY